MNCLNTMITALRGLLFSLVRGGRGVGGCRLAMAACLSMAGSGMAEDVQFIGVLKGQRFQQTSPSIVMLREEDNGSDDEALALEAFVDESYQDAVTNATLAFPGGAVVALLREDPFDQHLQYEYQTDTLLDLDTVHSNGTYTITLNTKNDGDQQVTLELVGDAYPTTPVITNYVALQDINVSEDIIVHWTPMAGGTPGDFIIFSVYDQESDENVFEEEVDGTALQMTIQNPSYWLDSGRSYEAEVMFVKVVDMDTNSYPNVPALAGYYKQTQFEIRTRAMPGDSLNAQYEGSIPQDGAGGVTRDSLIAFRFSQPMNTNLYAVTWTNVVQENFTYEWIEGDRVLLCRYQGSLPPNTEVGWTLGLSSFKDAANYTMSSEEPVSGSFYTASEAPASLADVSWASLIKIREYQQTGATPVSTGLYGCDVSLEQSAYNRVKHASLRIEANGFSQDFVAAEWDEEMEIDAVYASQGELDSFFANGDFTFSLDTVADGLQTMTLSLGPSDDYPAVPTVSNLEALQTVGRDAPVTLRWAAPANWTNELVEGHTFIEVGVDNDQGDEVYWIEGSELTSGSEAVIPAGVLWPGRKYEVSVTFINITDVNTEAYEGAMGVAGFASVTTFTLTTTGDPLMPAMQIATEGDRIKLSVSGGETQRSYVGEASTDLIRWVPLGERWLGEDYQNFELWDDDARYLKKRFYRLRDRLPDERVQRRITIQGTLWADSPGGTPVAGAVMGTTLDGQTAVTDEAGCFFLETDTPEQYGWSEYNVTVTVGESYLQLGSYFQNQLRNEPFLMQR